MVDIRPRAATAVAFSALVLALAGCTAAPPPDTAPTSHGSDVAEQPDAGAGPCDSLTPEQVGEAFGGEFGAGTPRIGEVTVQEVTWSTTGCSWDSADGVEVTYSRAGADDFPAGFECIEPGDLDGDVTPIDGLGDTAWWVWDDFQGGEGAVIVCAGEERIEIVVEGPRDGPLLDEAATRTGAETLAASVS